MQTSCYSSAKLRRKRGETRLTLEHFISKREEDFADLPRAANISAYSTYLPAREAGAPLFLCFQVVKISSKTVLKQFKTWFGRLSCLVNESVWRWRCYCTRAGLTE